MTKKWAEIPLWFSTQEQRKMATHTTFGLQGLLHPRSNLHTSHTKRQSRRKCHSLPHRVTFDWQLHSACLFPIKLHLFLGWNGWLEASQQSIHCTLLHPLPKNLSLPEARGCFLKACYWVGAGETGGW